MAEKKPLLLDLHIPYGVPSVRYIRSGVAGTNEEKNAYVNAMLREVSAWEGELADYSIKAVRLSGGFAMTVSPAMLGQLLAEVRKMLPLAADTEVSIDAPPNTIGVPSLMALAFGGPNRFALMLRSAVDSELQTLGCRHTREHMQNALAWLDRYHLSNRGITLHYGIPGQTAESWQESLQWCAELGVGSMTIAPLDYREGADLPTEEACLALYRQAVETLRAKGYRHYGAGLFSLPGYEDRYAMLENDGVEVLGIGACAVTILEGYISQNTNDLGDYCRYAGDFAQMTAAYDELSLLDRETDYVFGRLHLTEGLDRKAFIQRFGEALPETLERGLQQARAMGWLEDDGKCMRPTVEGLFYIEQLGELLA